MRSTRLLFLLIITQCYLIFTEANINSLEGTVYDSPIYRPSRDDRAFSHSDEWISNDGARFIRDTNEFTLTDKDDLNGLSASELESRLNRAQQNLEGKETEETRIKGQLETARKASQAANTTVDQADKDWKAALAEKERLEEPLTVLKNDMKDKEEILEKKIQLVATKERKVEFPRTAQDKKAYALNASASAERTLLVLNSRIDLLEEEETRLTNEMVAIEAKRKIINGKLDSYLGQLKKDGCPEPSFAKKSKAANGRRKRKEDCSNTFNLANSSHIELIKTDKPLADAVAELEKASKELREKKKAVFGLPEEIENWKNYTKALEEKDIAEAALNEARKKIDEPEELRVAIFEENKLSDALNAAKEAAPRSAAVFTRLEAEWAAATTEVENAKSIRNYYQLNYDNQTTPTPVVTAELPWLFIGVGVAGGAALLGFVALLIYCCWRRKRGRRKMLEEDPCLVVADGTLIPDETLFQYKEIVQYDAYEGDLPHDKAGEKKPWHPPTDYLYDKDRLFYSHFGLEPRIKTGKKTPTEIVDPANKADPIVGKRYVAANFFQPKLLDVVTEAVVLSWIKSAKQFDMPPNAEGALKIENRNIRCVPMPRDYIFFLITRASENNPVVFDRICSEPVLDKAAVRGEFLYYLHTMAAAPYKDNDPTSRFYVELTHIMWICCHARETLVKYHPKQLHVFSGSVVVVGDIHGQFPDLLRMFASRATAEKPGWLTHNYIFMGDYVDRGTFSVETVIFLFLLKILYPKNITLLRGNHEELMYNQEYGFYKELEERYPQCKNINAPINCLWRLFNDVFYHLPVAAVLNGNLFLAHGGITQGLATEYSKKKIFLKNYSSLKSYYSKVPMPFTEYVTATDLAEEFVGAQTAVRETMWNDPDKAVKGFVDNTKRGSGYRFGPDALSAFKKRHGIRMMMRGHQVAANGVCYPFNERTLIQIFSSPNYEENNKKKKKNTNNRACTIDIEVDGSMGLHIYGRLDSIKTQEEAMEAFRKYHRIGKGMIGEDVEDDLTEKVVRLKNTDKDKAVEKTAEDKPSDKDKKVEEKDKKVEEKDKKVEEKDKKVEEKNNKVEENKLLPEKTAEDKEDKVDENTLVKKTAEAPAKDEFPNIPPPSN